MYEGLDVRFRVGEVWGDLGERGEARGRRTGGEWPGFVGDVGFDGLLGDGGIL